MLSHIYSCGLSGIDVFGLDRNMLDESKVTIEPENALKSFGEKGEKLPAGALRYKE